MKRFALASVTGLLLSCSDAAERPPPAAPESRDAAAPIVADEYDDVIPRGAFPSVEALCAKQMEMIAPRLREAEANSIRERTPDDLPIAPSCVEDKNVMREVHVSLAAPLAALTAVLVETGYSNATFLVARTARGFVAIREAFLEGSHDDPGCPSIVRESALLEARVERGVLVVVTLADRAILVSDAFGELLLTRARACRVGGEVADAAARMTCDEPVVVAARTVEHPDGEASPNEKSIFATPFAVDASGSIAVGRAFEPSL